jgi:hypothetical protein
VSALPGTVSGVTDSPPDDRPNPAMPVPGPAAMAVPGPAAMPVPGPAASPAAEAVAAIRAASQEVAAADQLPLAEAARRFDVLHTELQTALTDLDRA